MSNTITEKEISEMLGFKEKEMLILSAVFKDKIKTALKTPNAEYRKLIKELITEGLSITRENNFGETSSKISSYEKQLVSTGYMIGVCISSDALKALEIEILRELEENRNNPQL